MEPYWIIGALWAQIPSWLHRSFSLAPPARSQLSKNSGPPAKITEFIPIVQPRRAVERAPASVAGAGARNPQGGTDKIATKRGQCGKERIYALISTCCGTHSGRLVALACLLLNLNMLQASTGRSGNLIDCNLQPRDGNRRFGATGPVAITRAHSFPISPFSRFGQLNNATGSQHVSRAALPYFAETLRPVMPVGAPASRHAADDSHGNSE